MSDPVRVLHVVNRMGIPGGVESLLMNLYRRIDRDMLQFDFAVCEDIKKGIYEDEIRELGGLVHEVPRLKPRNVLRFVRAWHTLLREHPTYEIVHGHLYSSASVYLNIARRHGCITVIHSHSTSSGTGSAALVKNFLQFPLRYRADYLIACSHKAGIWLYGKKAVKKDNYFVLKNAVDTNSFKFDEQKRRAARTALGMSDAYVVGHIGSFTPPKNHAFLIDIFSEVSQRNDGAILLLVGKGKLREETEHLARARGLSDRVIFAGARRDIPDLLCAMDAFLFPSKWEGLPVTIVEAQASGLPCIVSDVVTREVAISPLVTFCSLEDDTGVWAEKILSHAGGQSRPDMSQAVRDAGYDSASIAAFLQDFYLQALEKRRRHGNINVGPLGQTCNITSDSE